MVAPHEHLTHIVDVLCIEVFQSLYALEIVACGKPLMARCRIVRLETLVNHNLCGLTIFVYSLRPCRMTIVAFVHVVVRTVVFVSLACRETFVILECQCLVGFVEFHIRHSLYDRKLRSLYGVAAGGAYVAYLPTEVFVFDRWKAFVCGGHKIFTGKF